MFACVECGSKYKSKVIYCPCCGEHNQVIDFPEVDAGKVYLKTRNRQITSAKELITKHRSGQKIKGFEFLGSLPEEWTLLVYGVPGLGKSTFALLLSAAMQELTLYCAVEEGQSESIIRKLIEWEIRSEIVMISDARDTREIRQDISEVSPSVIVIDSITALGSTLKHNKTIWVSQSTKEGNFRGTQEIAHDSDIVLKIVEHGKVMVEKNRFGDNGMFSI